MYKAVVYVGVALTSEVAAVTGTFDEDVLSPVVVGEESVLAVTGVVASGDTDKGSACVPTGVVGDSVEVSSVGEVCDSVVFVVSADGVLPSVLVVLTSAKAAVGNAIAPATTIAPTIP